MTLASLAGQQVRPQIFLTSVSDVCRLSRRWTQVTITRAHRSGHAPGPTSVLVDAVRSIDWPQGIPYAWGGAERTAMTALRRYLLSDHRLAAIAVAMTAYRQRSKR